MLPLDEHILHMLRLPVVPYTRRWSCMEKRDVHNDYL